MNSIKVCKAAGDKIIDTFWDVGAGVSILDECYEARIKKGWTEYIISISLDEDGKRTLNLVVPIGRINQVKAWLTGAGYRNRDLLDMLYGKI